MRERICEMSYPIFSSNNTQFLVCNFATGWMKLVSACAVGRKDGFCMAAALRSTGRKGARQADRL